MQTRNADQAGQQDQTADTAREKIPAFVRLRYFRPSRSNGQEAGKPCAVCVCGGCSWYMCDQIRCTPAPVRRLFAAELVQIIRQGMLYRGGLDGGAVFTFAGDIDFCVRL